MPQDMTDYANGGVGHGTCVASVAAGVDYGVASNAELVVIKYKNAFRTNNGRIVQPSTTPSAAIAWAWRTAIGRALATYAGEKMRAVINFSGGKLSVKFSGTCWYFFFGRRLIRKSLRF